MKPHVSKIERDKVILLNQAHPMKCVKETSCRTFKLKHPSIFIEFFILKGCNGGKVRMLEKEFSVHTKETN